ncbi:hypothetical protein NDU88_002480 [Pleurodeles waltl]|uniref:Secreted protein n=1 Tax=Pleurodeles waltl TaxID=8319 RepID=A0AAV7TMR2_PLEWA|nr:hypothetical protein NDU88_002480 [Pleurodeles waltl]
MMAALACLRWAALEVAAGPQNSPRKAGGRKEAEQTGGACAVWHPRLASGPYWGHETSSHLSWAWMGRLDPKEKR